MKVILDVKEPKSLSTALDIYIRVSSQNPDQAFGNQNSLTINRGDTKFKVIRNQGSYTIRQV